MTTSWLKTFVDADGIYAISDSWKTIVPVNNYSRSDGSAIIKESDAIQSALESVTEDTAMLRSSSLVYAPIGNNMYKLAYEIVTTDGETLQIDAENGAVIER